MNRLKQIITQLVAEGYHAPKAEGCACGCNTCHLPKTDFTSVKEQIKPIIKAILSEDNTSTVIGLEGILTTDPTARNQGDILSDIRSISGITIVRSKDIDSDITLSDPNAYRTRLSVKIDPHPFIGKGGFGSKELQHIVDEIKRVTGVKSFKLTTKPKRI